MGARDRGGRGCWQARGVRADYPSDGQFESPPAVACELMVMLQLSSPMV